MSNRIADGTQIGPYRIVKLLGEGGMGRTYLAEQDGIELVLKECLEDAGADLLADLEREAKFLARLRHPRLPAVKDFRAINPGQVFMVMEYIPGRTLKTYLEELPKSPGWNQTDEHLRQVLDWSLQLTETLDYLHKLRPYPVIHRDIKPVNIMVRRDGQVALIDFGIARYFKADKAVRKEKDTIIGFTAGWVAPEYVHFKRSTPQCDIYSLGMVIHYLLSGQGPDEDGDDVQQLPKLAPTGDKLWDQLIEISEKARHPEPASRYATAADLARALLALTGGQVETGCAVCGKAIRITVCFCPYCGSPARHDGNGTSGTSAPRVVIQLGGDHPRLREEILRAVAQASPSHLERFRICQQIEEMEHDPGFGELVSLDNLPKVEKLPHQIDVARTALQQMGGYCLLADEVGLGKTIEAGIILKELMLRGLATRVLIITPNGITTQWQQELFDKFDEYFLVFGRDVGTTLAWKCDRVIAPYKVAEDRTHRLAVMAQKYDLVVMDEAHHLIVADPHRGWQLHEFARRLGRNTRFFLMVSATPLHNNLRELHTLLTLLKPGSVDDYQQFASRYVDKTNPLQPRNVEELRTKLQSVMIRNTRRRIKELRFPRREAYRVPVAIPPQHGKLFREFRRFVRTQLWRMADQLARARRDAGMNAAFRSALQELIESFHSSPLAFQTNCESFLDRFRALLRSRADAAVGERLQEFKRAMPPDLNRNKIEEVCKILTRRAPYGGKFLVFSQYDDTAEELFGRVTAQTGLQTVLYPPTDAQHSTDLALEAMARFRSEAVVMVCGPNAAEGLNLQAAHSMINFDLPWDPMKLEQRIGRIQRLGQKAPKIFIWNLFLQDTIEQDILNILDSKIRMFGQTIGEVEEILGNLADDESFDNQLLDLFLADAESDEERKKVEEQMDELLAPGRRKTSTAAKLLGGIFAEQDTAEAERSRPEAQRPRPNEPPSDVLERLGGGSLPALIHCIACGHQIDPDADFCSDCGEPQAPAEFDDGKSRERQVLTAVAAGQAESVPMIACQQCQRLQPIDRPVCENCGNPLNVPSDEAADESAEAWEGETPRDAGSFCTNCGEPVEARAEFCTQCGESLRS